MHPNNCSTKVICLSKQEPQVQDICFRPHGLEEAWSIDRENDASLINRQEGEQDRCPFQLLVVPASSHWIRGKLHGSLSLSYRETKKAKDDECKCSSGISCEVVPVPLTLSERGWEKEGTFGRYASAKTKDMQPYDGTGKGHTLLRYCG